MKKFTKVLMLWFFAGLLTISGFSQAFVQIGIGTGHYPLKFPFYNFFENNKTQTLYLQSELGSSQTYTDLGYNIHLVAPAGHQEFTDFTVKFLHTSVDSLTSGAYHDMSLATTVFGPANLSFATSTGWFSFDITDFAYNGTDNLIVEVIWGDEGSYTADCYMNYKTDGGVTRTLYGYSDNQTPPDYYGPSTYFSNMRFYYVGPPSPESPTNPKPADEQAGVTLSGNLTWDFGANTDTYDLLFGPAGSMTQVVTGATAGASGSYAYSSLPILTEYEWQVIAHNSVMATTYGAIWNFTTACSAITAPWLDDFEAHIATDSTIWGNCWASNPSGTDTQFRWDLDDDGSTPSPNTGPSGAHSGSKYAYMEATYGGTGAIAELYTPLIDLTGLSSPGLFFYYHMYGEDIGTLHVDVHDGSNWNNDVFSITGQQQSSGDAPWIQHFVDISTYSGTIQICFRGERGSGYAGDISIDDVSITEGISCPAPYSLTQSNINSSGADLGWLNNGSATYWDVYVTGAGGAAPNAGTTPTIDNTTSNPVTWSGGTLTTTYDWYVRADCFAGGGTGQSTWAGPSTFTTFCNPYTAPFSDNFDETPVGTIPDCWHKIVEGPSPAYIKVIDYSSYSPPNNLRMYNSSSTTGTLIASTPELSDLTSQLNQIRFYAKRSTNTTSALVVGTMTDPNDETTFTAFQSIDLTTTYTEYTVMFGTGYSDTAKYISLRHACTSTNDNIYIDDFVYEAIPSAGISVNLTAFLEGPFNGTDMNTTLNPADIPLTQPYGGAPWNYSGTESVTSIPNADIVDWVLVELRDTTEAQYAVGSTIIARQAAFILNDGSIVGLDGTSFLTFNVTIENYLFAVIWHRNHLGILSANALSGFGNVYAYNFSTGENKAYGGANGHKEIVTDIWGMIASDGNADRSVNLLDKDDVWEQQAGEEGYKSGDYNLNGQVNNPDKDDIWLPNNGSGSQVPE